MSTYEENRVKFYTTYPNVPLGVRKQIIYVDDDFGPMTWQVIWFEVEARTKISEKILEGLVALKFI